jgi:DNA (cytosine-5)-methyltransferase 1
MTVSAVDLFCGAGGLTHGLIAGGVKVRAGYDIDGACKWPYEKNNKGAKFFDEDVSELKGAQLSAWFQPGEVKLLAGCAPCQPFSTYSLGKTDSEDKRWSMLSEFQRLVDELNPDLVTMENVPQLQKHAVFDSFVEALKTNYHVSVKVVLCTEYGIPQTRKRLVLLASRFGPLTLRERHPRKDRLQSLSTVIGKMPPLNAGEQHSTDPLHICSALSPQNFARIQASTPGGSWRDWDEDLVAECHRGDAGRTFSSVYGRMAWEKPAPTITTQFFGFGNGRFGHPEQDRALSLREGAILQTFPKKYSFIKPGAKVEMKNIGRLIGNAVPVKLGKVIAESIIEHLNLHNIPH